MNLNEIRRRIDQVDRELLVLLQERMGLAMRSKKFKKNVADPRREQYVLARAERMSLDLVERSFARQILQTIIGESKRIQEEQRLLVAFQGEHGAFGEVAARRLVPGGAYIPCLEFVDVFRGVQSRELDLGVVPVENSLEGAVTPVNDLLITTDLKIVGEAEIPIQHCLLAPQESDPKEIREVYSHPQALAQCQAYILRNRMEPRPFFDTAGAAKMLARQNPRSAAAIASALCAELYDLEIVDKAVEEGPANSTRFVLLGPEPYPGKGSKTSIIFSAAHQAGELYKLLRLFAEAGINLTRIASMPQRTSPGNYSFFLDFEGSIEEPHIVAVMDQLAGMTVAVKWLGSYPADKSGVSVLTQ
jgi:prephenate dehydratase/chorismate mutase